MDVIYENKTRLIEHSITGGLVSFAHLHKELEIIYVRKGKAVAYADKNSYLLNAGDMFIAFPNQVHYYRTVIRGEFMVLIFSPDILYDVSSKISKSKPDINCFTPLDDGNLKDIFDSIYSLDGEYKNIAISGYLNVVMSRILPKLRLQTVDTENNSAFFNVIDFCTRNFKDDITLDIVAEELHLSKYYISRLINNRLKQNFNEYINNLRISEACNLLRVTDEKIADISEDVGFGTIRSFNRAFKLVMGISPAEYRSKNNALKEI
ncbi:MAG: AraC family transcriptional regulator [Acutalibacteraceae bacterium]|nr:AraC family transcriptional regulator [Acutalibacteraceae bacterium]